MSIEEQRSAGIDKLEVEFLKYAPIEIPQEIANIYKTVTSTEEELSELVVSSHTSSECYKRNPNIQTNETQRIFHG